MTLFVGTGDIDLLEFMELMIQCGGVEEDELEVARKVFERYDVDGSGLIDRAEFRECILALAPNKQEKEIAAMLFKADANQDGEINFKVPHMMLQSGECAHLNDNTNTLHQYCHINQFPTA
jgi:Ca2+-binding EF-hand superfamily protein